MWEKIAYLLWHREEGCSQPDFSCERLLTTRRIEYREEGCSQPDVFSSRILIFQE